MNLSKTIRQLSRERGLTITELSARVGQSAQNLSKKLRNETLSFQEFEQLLGVMGLTLEMKFTEQDGQTITLSETVEHSENKIAMLEAQLAYGKKSAEYLASLGYGVRTAAYTISGNTQFALNHMDNPFRVGECLKKIRQANQQITEIVNEQLKYSDIDNDLSSLPETNRVENHGGRILVVDDNVLNREITREMLQDLGFLVDEADDGDMALQMIQNSDSKEYACVLMDLQMPKMDGWTATQKIRMLKDNEKANVPIVAMTANTGKEERTKALGYGMNDYLVKPVDPMQLMQVFKRV